MFLITSSCSTLTELAKEQKKFAQIRRYDSDDASDAESIQIDKEASAISFLEFLKKARTGETSKLVHSLDYLMIHK
jgi:hypothetical protein